MAEEVNNLKRKHAADDAECQEQKRIREEQEFLRKKQERLRKKQERLRKEQERVIKEQGLLQDKKEQERKDQLLQQSLQKKLADFVEAAIATPLEPEITERVLSCRKLGEIIEKTIKTKHETLDFLKSTGRVRMPDGNPVTNIIANIRQEIAKLNDTLLEVSFYPFE